MITQIKNWLNKRFANPELVILLFSILAFVLVLHFFAGLLAPVLASVVIAYLLDGLVLKLERWRFPKMLAVSLVCLLFVGVFLLAFLVLLPLVWQQTISLVSELPSMFKSVEVYLLKLPERYPDMLSTTTLHNFINSFQADFSNLGREIVKYSLSTVFSLITIVVYCILVPLMVFFFLKDRDRIISWFAIYMPRRRRLIREVWYEVNEQIGNYIRAKVLEVIIIGVVSMISFWSMGLRYAILLAVLTGLSVLVPYAGVIIVSIPVLIIAFLQWGLVAHFLYFLLIYSIIMVLDGNVLAPLLFSETMRIHPLAVIVAVIIFGGIWGFWGVFFAIPLATVVMAILNVWRETGKEIEG